MFVIILLISLLKHVCKTVGSDFILKLENTDSLMN